MVEVRDVVVSGPLTRSSPPHAHRARTMGLRETWTPALIPPAASESVRNAAVKLQAVVRTSPPTWSPSMIDFAREIPRAPVTTPPSLPAPPPPISSAPESLAPESSAPESSAPEDLEKLGDEIAELAAHLHAATYRLLVLVRAFDTREGWHNGFRSCAHWLSWRTGIAIGPAREKVRVAQALERLPLLSKKMRSGQLSYSKVRALTRVATGENELELMEFALHGTASHVESLVRAWKRVDRVEEQLQERKRHSTRSLSLYADESGMYVLRGRLDPEVGALLMRALEAAGEAVYGRAGGSDVRTGGCDASEIEPPTAGQRCADAIGLLAERALQGGLGGSVMNVAESIGEAEFSGSSNGSVAPIGRADRFQVVLHVDAEALRDSSEGGDSMLAGDVRVPAGTSRRLACDASRVIMTHAPDGSVLDVGRKTRTVPPAIRRALDHRDGGCRFPGCGLRFCDAHHITHWADGGETRLDNLVLLCRRHHRAVHEEGFGVEFVEGIRFYWPDGLSFPDVPAPPHLPALDPVTVLTREHDRLSIHIDADTTTPGWNGEPFDLGWAICVFRNR